MAKNKPDVIASEKYMNDVVSARFANLAKAVNKRKDYIWYVPDKFSSLPDIFKNCHSETEVGDAGQISLTRHGNSELKQTSPKLKSDQKPGALQRPRQNVQERYQKLILESRQDTDAGNVHRQKMDVEYRDNEKEYMKEMSETKQNSKTPSTKNISGDIQHFTSKRPIPGNAARDQPYEQVTHFSPSHSSQMRDNFKTSNIKASFKNYHDEKLLYKHDTVQRDLKQKQRPMYGSTGNIIYEYNARRSGLNSPSSAQRTGRSKATEKRSRREFESHAKNNSPNTTDKLPLDMNQCSSEEKCVNEVSEKTKKFLLCLNIWKHDENHEFIIFLSDWNRIKQKYPKILEVLPDIDTGEKEVKYCFDAVYAVMTFLFTPHYNFDLMYEERTAIEILAASRSWEIHDFRNDFQEHFLQKYLSQRNVKELYSLAHHFGESDICDACKNFTEDDALLNLTSSNYGQMSCFIKLDSYNEPLECSIPLEEASPEDRDGYFKSSIQAYITNEITFEVISGSYAIKGFEINLNVDNDQNANDLKVSYDASNGDENIVLHEQKSKPVRPKIFIYFKKKLVVKSNQKGIITVDIHIKPRLCYVIKNDKITERNSEGAFNLSLTSTCKTKRNEKRFLVGKLLYNLL